jgi:hypothetical protein
MNMMILKTVKELFLLQRFFKLSYSDSRRFKKHHITDASKKVHKEKTIIELNQNLAISTIYCFR